MKKNNLDKNINYIISGLERSGTSMLMQILNKGGIPIAFNDDLRPPDESNPKGYYELEGGKIINRLMDGIFPFNKYKGNVIKITAYGLKFLPKGKYRIIYSERNIEEILDSMEKMSGKKDENREETKEVFVKLNEMIKKLIKGRNDIEVLFVNYNTILSNPKDHIKKIYNFLNLSNIDLNKIIETVDNKLYRQRRQ
jgi:hypothetical protein